jgi:hypothetical protein
MVTTKCHSVNTNDLFSLEQAGVLRRICMAFRRRKHTHTRQWQLYGSILKCLYTFETFCNFYKYIIITTFHI